MRILLFTLLVLFTHGLSLAQEVVVHGLITDNQNNRKLTDVAITAVVQGAAETIRTVTDKLGSFTLSLPLGSDYTLQLELIAFEPLELAYSTKGLGSADVLNIGMKRLPGYEFQADVKELLSGGKERVLGQELTNIKIEIFNNTSGKEVKVVEDDPKNTFEANFERGNHYTILLRKQGYFAKRVEVNVDIYGCVLCFEGLGNNYAPQIEEAMESGNERGVLIADIPMKKIVRDEAIRLDNIYYDYDKWTIRSDARPALDKLVETLRRNPIIIELGSHTDSRGKSKYNSTLSDNRAKAAVDYIVSKGIKAHRISSKGYGESVLLNDCSDGVQCTETEHQLNRRTEFKVTAFVKNSSFDDKSLKQIMEEEKATKQRSVERIKIMD